MNTDGLMIIAALIGLIFLIVIAASSMVTDEKWTRNMLLRIFRKEA